MPVPDTLLADIRSRLASGKRVRKALPDEGRLHVDRPLPFLVVFRSPPGLPHGGSTRLATTQASYLLARDGFAASADLRRLVALVARTLAEALGACLVIDLFESTPGAEAGDGSPLPSPAFTLATARPDALAGTVETLAGALAEVRVGGRGPRVERSPFAALEIPGLPPLSGAVEEAGEGCHWLGLGLRPVHRGPEGELRYPGLLLELESGLARALLKGVHRFARDHAGGASRFPHFHSLGRRALVRTAWHVDRRLAEVAGSFDFMLGVTPVNAEAAWKSFQQGGCAEPPRFLYRPLPFDPEGIKRTLYNLAIEKIEDATLAGLFREKQEELDRQITMLRDRETPRFLWGSLQLYGPVEDELLKLAEKILDRVPAHRRDDAPDGYLSSAPVAERAREEIARYRQRYARFEARVEVRDDLLPGMMVSKGSLLVSRQASIPPGRLDALLQHEVGTHLVTYFNGRAQRLRLFHAGLAGYEELQEGLAVLAEHLVGGLNRPRLRLLAARVVACRSLTAGASFVEVFRRLVADFGFREKSAFTIVSRVFRGGGLTKDALYLRGFRQVLAYLRAGGDLEPLFVGKLAATHVPVVEELRHRGFLEAVPLAPAWLARPAAQERLDALRRGASVLDLMESSSEGEPA